MESSVHLDASDINIKAENLENVNKTFSEEPVLSKRQQKLLAKRQRWLELKPLRKAKEKEKRKMKIKKAKETGQDLGPSRKMLKSLRMADSPCKLKICFDMSLAHLMTPPEFSKTFKQLHRCYSINRRAPAPLQLYITGYSKETEEAMSKMSGCFNWDVNFRRETHCEVFDKSNIIYLTSDSPNVIETLDYQKTYIIGALVDHNRLKNICFDKAVEENIGHARLPLDTYFKFKTRKVLTIDQVYSIFLRLSEGKSWIDAVMDVVPKRKGVEVKDTVEDASDNSSAEEENSHETVDDKIHSPVTAMVK